jgi:hypothetical protein
MRAGIDSSVTQPSAPRAAPRPALSRVAPTNTPTSAERPATRVAASATPADGNSGEAKPGGPASINASAPKAR